jgi:hypothetical protein
VDDVTWGALAFVLTVLGGSYTRWAYQNRGLTAATRGAALTLIPPAAWATGTLKMFTRIGDAIVDWATHLVFSPLVWLGIVLAGVSAMLFGVAGFLHRRELGGAPEKTPKKPAKKSVQQTPKQPGALNAPDSRPRPAIDDDLSEIEAILKKRGIS